MNKTFSVLSRSNIRHFITQQISNDTTYKTIPFHVFIKNNNFFPSRHAIKWEKKWKEILHNKERKEENRGKFPREIFNYLRFRFPSVWTKAGRENSFRFSFDELRKLLWLSSSCPEELSSVERWLMECDAVCSGGAELGEKLFIWLNNLHINLCSSFRDWINIGIANRIAERVRNCNLRDDELCHPSSSLGFENRRSQRAPQRSHQSHNFSRSFSLVCKHFPPSENSFQHFFPSPDLIAGWQKIDWTRTRGAVPAGWKLGLLCPPTRFGLPILLSWNINAPIVCFLSPCASVKTSEISENQEHCSTKAGWNSH